MSRQEFPRTSTDHAMGFVGLSIILAIDVTLVVMTEPFVASMGRPLWLIVSLMVVLFVPAAAFVHYWWGGE